MDLFPGCRPVTLSPLSFVPSRSKVPLSPHGTKHQHQSVPLACKIIHADAQRRVGWLSASRLVPCSRMWHSPSRLSYWRDNGHVCMPVVGDRVWVTRLKDPSVPQIRGRGVAKNILIRTCLRVLQALQVFGLRWKTSLGSRWGVLLQGNMVKWDRDGVTVRQTEKK